MKIDWTKLKAAIHDDTRIIRSLKANGSRSSAYSMKLQATLHHAIAAHLRSHIHLSGKFLCNPKWLGEETWAWYERNGMTLNEQAKFIEKELQKFLVPEAPKETNTAA